MLANTIKISDPRKTIPVIIIIPTIKKLAPSGC
jgi:hypothetical protein